MYSLACSAELEFENVQKENIYRKNSEVGRVTTTTRHVSHKNKNKFMSVRPEKHYFDYIPVNLNLM